MDRINVYVKFLKMRPTIKEMEQPIKSIKYISFKESSWPT